MFDYRQWVGVQSAIIEAGLRRPGRDVSGLAVYFVPASGTVPGQLILADATPPGATDVLRFPGVGSRVASIAYQFLRENIYDACRRLPVIPPDGPLSRESFPAPPA